MLGKSVFPMLCLLLPVIFAQDAQGDDLPGIPPATVADYLHAVIEADRTFYTIHVVERMQKEGAATAAETWRRDKTTLPLPAQFLQEANQLGTLTGTQIRYRLVSLWPINPQNAPASEPERIRLQTVSQHPEQAATGMVTISDRPYFQAVYADRAVTQACIGCHNAHPRSPRHDFKIGDVLGGLLIEIPLK